MVHGPRGPHPPFEGLPSLGALNGVPFVTVGTGPRSRNFPVGNDGGDGGLALAAALATVKLVIISTATAILFICESDCTPLERDNRLSGRRRGATRPWPGTRS